MKLRLQEMESDNKLLKVKIIELKKLIKLGVIQFGNELAHKEAEIESLLTLNQKYKRLLNIGEDLTKSHSELLEEERMIYLNPDSEQS